MRKTIFWVMYDGIENSVFAGQVLAPILRRLEREPDTRVVLVSFEQKTFDSTVINRVIAAHERLTVVVTKRMMFFGMLSLLPAVYKLRKLIYSFGCAEIIARGAQAGFIAQRANAESVHISLTVQARGLLAQEYAHTHSAVGLLRWAYALRAWQYHRLERAVYSADKKNLIEVVSIALRDYLVEAFKADPAQCQLAVADIPETIEPARVATWREQVREELKIDLGATVFCFSGAGKAWQNPGAVVDFFCLNVNGQKNTVLLVLTPDIQNFERVLSARLSRRDYRLLHVCHKEIYRYLAAADVGIVLREAGVVSWVSRPVKAMEYEAVGLRIVHNNTVQWLIERHGRSDILAS